MPLTFPSSELDNAQKLLSLVGSFWSHVYGSADFVSELLLARGQIQSQAQLDFAELLASVSRFTVPVFHTDNWYALTLRESEKNATAANLPKFDGTYTFESGLFFDNPVATAGLTTFQAPDTLSDVRMALDGIIAPNLVLTQGTDFYLANGAIWLRLDPFQDDRVTKIEEIADGQVVDRTCVLWLYRGQYDLNYVYEQFGYAVAGQLQSGRNYRDFVNAVYDGLVVGTTRSTVENLFAALTDVPLAKGTETVQVITNDARGLLIITDKNAYRFASGSTPIVAVHDVVNGGDSLTDTVRFFTFGRGQVPPEADVNNLVVSPGFLAAGYFEELVFANKSVPLVVEENVDGFTKVSFELGGFPGDVDKFWSDVHTNGIAAGQTLAMLLDQRTNKIGQPTAAALPTTINPLAFLVANLLRDNAYVVLLRPNFFGPNSLGLSQATLLRKLVPPHTACIVLVQLAASTDTVTMDGPGDATRAGYTETLTSFQGTIASDAVDPSSYVTESPRLRQIRGRCA